MLYVISGCSGGGKTTLVNALESRNFMAPPWPEIFESDPERLHSMKNAVAEYERLVATYTLADYSILLLPKSSLTKRIEFVLDNIE